MDMGGYTNDGMWKKRRDPGEKYVFLKTHTLSRHIILYKIKFLFFSINIHFYFIYKFVVDV